MSNIAPGRVKLLFPNLVYLSSLSGGRWKGGDLSLQALLDPVMGHVARSMTADPADTQFVIELDRSRQIGGVAVLEHNLSINASVIVQGYRDKALTECVHNPDGDGVPAFPAIHRTGEIAYGEPNWWSLKARQEDVGLVTTLVLVLLPVQRYARYWRVRIVDPRNPAGFVDLGKIFIGPSFDPPFGYSRGAALTPVDESRGSTSRGGVRSWDRRRIRRRMAFDFNYLSQERDFGAWFDFLVAAGITQEIMVIADPTDTRNIQRRSFCATLTQPTPLEQAQSTYFNASHVAEEVL